MYYNLQQATCMVCGKESKNSIYTTRKSTKTEEAELKYKTMLVCSGCHIRELMMSEISDSDLKRELKEIKANR